MAISEEAISLCSSTDASHFRIGIDKPTPNGIIIPTIEVVQSCLGWVLLCTRRGCPPPGYFFGRLLAEKENGSVMYQQASPFGDKRQFVGIIPSP